MTTKHTPGPWKVHFVQNAHTYAVYDQTETLRHIADVSTPFGADGYAIGHANARLIAAAPELLDMCKKTERLLDPMTKNPASDDFMRELRSAIAKATSHAKEIAKKEQEEQEQNDSDGHFALVPLTEFVDNGGILEKHREIFTEFQGRFYSKLLDHYENGIVYVKQYPDDKGEALSETAYVKCPAQVQYK